jgi:iron complex transport system substrate-binding protein
VISRAVKIVSLLPSATEIVFALGLGDALEGRSFECDYPAEATRVPVVSGTALPEAPMTAREIDDAVTERVAAGESIYTLDAERIRAIQPDVILAQDLCEVCAVPSGAVTDALDVLGCSATVVSLDPVGLDGVIACIGEVGAVTGRNEVADALMRSLHLRVKQVRGAVAGLANPRVLPLEWADPPFNGGHWIPDMLLAAGTEPVLSPVGARSRRLEWDEIAAAAPDAVLFMPCGYDLDGAVREAAPLLGQEALAAVEQIWAVDANAFFSRPGPRVVDGVELVASLFHPEAVEPRGGAMRVR